MLHPITHGDWHISEMSLSLDHRLMPVCKLASQRHTVHYLVHPKMFKIFVSHYNIVGMYRQFCAFIYEFLTMVAEFVVQGVHKIVIQSSFSVTWRHKVN